MTRSPSSRSDQQAQPDGEMDPLTALLVVASLVFALAFAVGQTTPLLRYRMLSQATDAVAAVDVQLDAGISAGQVTLEHEPRRVRRWSVAAHGSGVTRTVYGVRSLPIGRGTPACVLFVSEHPDHLLVVHYVPYPDNDLCVVDGLGPERGRSVRASALWWIERGQADAPEGPGRVRRGGGPYRPAG